MLFEASLLQTLWSSGQSSWLHNGDVLWFLWGTNWIYISYEEESRPPLWSSGQSSWLQIQRSGYHSRRYQIFWEVVGLERGPLKPREYNWGATWKKRQRLRSIKPRLRPKDPSRWSRGTLYPQKLALTSPTSGGRSVGIIRSRIQATELFEA
jgi:hypothetical protein